jgi:hypothetical protein
MIMQQALNPCWDQLVNRLLSCSLEWSWGVVGCVYAACCCLSLLDWGLYRNQLVWPILTPPIQLHLVHCITHSNYFLVCFMVHWTKFPIAWLICNCLEVVKLFHLFTDLPSIGSHTSSGPSSPFQTLLGIILCLYKLLTCSLSSILHNWS